MIRSPQMVAVINFPNFPFCQIPAVFVGVVGSDCRMYTKVVLHKQTSLRYRIQRLFRRQRGSAARSKPNLDQNRRAAPENVGFDINVSRPSHSLITSDLFVQSQSARTTANLQTTRTSPKFLHDFNSLWLKRVSRVRVVNNHLQEHLRCLIAAE